MPADYAVNEWIISAYLSYALVLDALSGDEMNITGHIYVVYRVIVAINEAYSFAK